MKKSMVILGLTALISSPIFAQDNESVANTKTEIVLDDAKKPERWYQKPKTSIEIYGVIDIGYRHTNTR